VCACVYVHSLCPQLDVEQNIVKQRLNQDGNIVEGTEVVAGTYTLHTYIHRDRLSFILQW